MQRYEFQTPVGDIWLWGEAGAVSGDKPIVLWINGAFAIERPSSYRLSADLPQADVLVAHLPGNHCPQPLAHSVGVYAAAFSSVLEQIGRPAVVVGASIGALAAFAIRSPLVRGLVALDPPLRTGKLWPLLQPYRDRLAQAPDDARQRELIWSVFGVSENAQEDRDYTALLAQIAAPTWAVFGEQPLFPQRPLARLPSLVDEPERALLRAHPRISTALMPGAGHNVAGQRLDLVAELIARLLRETCGA